MPCGGIGKGYFFVRLGKDPRSTIVGGRTRDKHVPDKFFLELRFRQTCTIHIKEKFNRDFMTYLGF